MSALQRDMTAELAALPEITLSPDSEPPAQRGIRVLHMADQTLTPVGLYVAMIDYSAQLRGADKGIRRLRRKFDRLQTERDELKLANDKLGAQNEILRKALAKRRVASPEEFAKQW
jgi:hypothetical protein